MLDSRADGSWYELALEELEALWKIGLGNPLPLVQFERLRRLANRHGSTEDPVTQARALDTELRHAISRLGGEEGDALATLLALKPGGRTTSAPDRSESARRNMTGVSREAWRTHRKPGRRRVLLSLLVDEMLRGVAQPDESILGNRLFGDSLVARVLDEELRRLRAIHDGEMTLHSQDEAVRFFRLLSDYATQRIYAVDFISIKQWRENRRLYDYLDAQLASASRAVAAGAASDGVQLERIRLVAVEEDLKDPVRRGLLRQFVTKHDQAGARLWLCPRDEDGYGGTLFYRRTGCVLVDSGDHAACVTATLDKRGAIERAVVYLKATERVRECERDFRKLVDHIDADHLDEKLREQVFEPKDDDEDQPDWSDRPDVGDDPPIGDAF